MGFGPKGLLAAVSELGHSEGLPAPPLLLFLCWDPCVLHHLHITGATTLDQCPSVCTCILPVLCEASDVATRYSKARVGVCGALSVTFPSLQRLELLQQRVTV